MARRKGYELPEIADEEQKRLLTLLRRHRKQLLAYEGVHYVDIGFELEGGKPTGRLAIRAHVHEKQEESRLESNQILPEELDGVPVDVIQSNPEEQQSRDARRNPLVGGVNVGNSLAPSIGTLGTVVFDRRTLEPMALSNHHVLVRGSGSTSDLIAQPGSASASNVIGQLARWSKARDCAVSTLNGSRAISTAIVDYPGGAAGVATPQLGVKVAKSGRTTATTFGQIDGVSTDSFTIVPDPARPPAGGEISAGGDSGSVWLAVQGNAAIGLHYAGETDPSPSLERAWAKLMTAVTATLDVFVPDWALVSTPAVAGSTLAVVARTAAGAPCSIRVVYPSGRVSAARTLRARNADAHGIVRWTWVPWSGTRPSGPPARAELTLGGVQRTLEFELLPPA
jgi:hypothetical protein